LILAILFDFTFKSAVAALRPVNAVLNDMMFTP
jgi:hypothetical protein